MKAYNRLLLAVELDPKIDALPIEHALGLVAECDADLFLVHVMEHMGSYGAAYGVAAGADIESLMHKKAKQHLKALGDKLGVPEENLLLKAGSGATVILEEAESHSVDLIIVGSHVMHGIRHLFGSTADGVITSAKCDVLAVRVGGDH